MANGNNIPNEDGMPPNDNNVINDIDDYSDDYTTDFDERIKILRKTIDTLQNTFPDIQQSVYDAEVILSKLARQQLHSDELEPGLRKSINSVTVALRQLLREMNRMFVVTGHRIDEIFDSTDIRIENSKIYTIDAIKTEFLDILRQKIEEAEDSETLGSIFYPLVRHATKTIIDNELKDRNRLLELLTETKDAYQLSNKRIIFLTKKIQKYEVLEVNSKNELLNQIRTLRGEFTDYIQEHNADMLFRMLTQKLEEIEHTTYESIQDIQDKYQEVLDVIRGEKTGISSDGLQNSFETLIHDLIQFELEQMDQFGRLLRKEILTVIDEKFQELGSSGIHQKFVPLIDAAAHEVIDVKLKEEKQFAELLRADLLQVINEELNTKKDEPGLYDNFIPLIEETSRQIIDVKLRDEKRFVELLRAELLQVIKEELAAKEQPVIYDNFLPLIDTAANQIIDKELDEGGKFVKLLTDKFIEMSDEKDQELQKKFRAIVERVGRGMFQNEALAKRTTAIGLRGLSEADLDEVLGAKIAKIIDKQSAGFGATMAETLASFGTKINSIMAFGGQQEKVKKFFDGFSFSIYYYYAITSDDITIKRDTLLPKKFMQQKERYAGEFDNLIADREAAISKDPPSYQNYISTLSLSVGPDEDPTDVYCHLRYFNSTRVYFFLSKEPSSYFKSQLTKILEKNKKLSAEKLKKLLDELSLSYTIPKVDIALFNSKDFKLPSDDGNSVLASQDGRAYLTEDEETQLTDILKKVREYFDAHQGIWQRVKPRFGTKPGAVPKFSDRFIPHFGGGDYISAFSIWHFWARKNPKKLLVVKLQRPLSGKKKGKAKSERDNFTDYVNRDIWTQLVETKTLSEMQDWINVFVQKDAGVFSGNSFLSRLIILWRQATNTAYIALIVLAGFVVYHTWGPLSEKFIETTDTIKDVSIRLVARIDGTEDALTEQQQNAITRIAQLESDVATLKNIEPPQPPLSFTEADKALMKDVYDPFVFAYKQARVDQLSPEDSARLNRIAENLIKTEDKWKIIIYRYNNPTTRWNRKRAESIRNFLIHRGVSDGAVSISDEIETLTRPGVRLKLDRH